MNKILFLHSLLTEEQVEFINKVSKILQAKKTRLVLLGWDKEGKFNLHPEKIQLPVSITQFDTIYKKYIIRQDFEQYALNLKELVDRFDWWFPKSRNKKERSQRESFLHYHLHFFLKLINLHDPSLIIVWNGNDPRQLLLSRLCENLNIKTLFMERGTLPSLWFYDTKGVLGNSTVANFRFDNAVFDITYTNRLELYQNWYFHTSETLWEQPARNEQINIKDKFGIKSGQEIILFVGQVDNDIQTKLFSPYFKSNKDAFQWFINYGVKDDYFVIGKHHPKSQVSVSHYREAIGINENIVWTDELKLDECLKVADFVVTVNSSVIFDALLFGKPVLSLGTTILDGKNILYEYSPATFENLSRDFYSKNDLTKKIINFKFFLGYLLENNFIYFNDSNAAQEFSRILLSFEKDTTKKLSSDKSLKVLETYIVNKTKIENSHLRNRSVTSKLSKIFKKIRKRIGLIVGK
ncbi:CDP-glycerol glycerophosphotransferase family protein [Salinimicrobium tongyeongense]|uniref:CDP-glycerol glycerophosphotransferase family protein n=1 Tax=Salinimicrobium tongyeongense TaxID=2809707 RepID=A0ABY6NRW3_9FLAO|nr:CDP-glycerol glycerophosphotransferase family protein [Salinimicrobium tongyeongense]UZH55642.1 CDP-glycerol glycerophosphotransferase family protein [Salinimicrobium tongyeongense]